MNQEDALALFWAKKLAIQVMLDEQKTEDTFTCPLCGGRAHVHLDESGYTSYCESGCFTSVK